MVFEAIDVVQLDDCCEVVWQLRQRCADLFTRQSRCYLVENDIPFGRNQFIMRFFESSNRHELSPTGVPVLVLAQHAAQDPIKPGAHLGWIPQVVQPKPGAATRLLNRVLCVRADVHASRGERQQAVEMGNHQRFEARVAVRNRG